MFLLSRKFGRDYTFSLLFIETVPGSYDHFKKWFERGKNKQHNSKCTSSFKGGKVILKCNYCYFETPISSNSDYWKIGHFKKLLRDSSDCPKYKLIQENEATTSMDSSDNIEVCFTFYLIANTKIKLGTTRSGACGFLLSLIL